MNIFSEIEGFEWDEGNISKSWIKHGVTYFECEEVFFNEPLIVKIDKVHSGEEDRYYVLGKTDMERLLFIVFTIRGKRIRVISARDTNKKERRLYYETVKKDTEIQK
ncbi:MAG TPA: hypothetical protein DEP99_05110 [Nitrospiraceae bacterium]|nr:hypothetical protein [Nitrospiraceae bacterium]